MKFKAIVLILIVVPLYLWGNNTSILAKLDSTIINEYQKSSYFYTNDGRIDYVSYQNWQENTNKWGIPWKVNYEYDTNSRLISITNYNWHAGIQDYIPSMKESYTYSSSNNVFQKISTTWSNNQWVNSSKVEYSYNIDNQILSQSNYLWSTNKWNTNHKNEYTYDNNGNNLSDIYSLPNANATGWRYAVKQEKTYDADNNLLSTTRSNYNTSTSKWIFFDKQTYHYNENTKLLDKKITNYWNGSTWEKSAETTYTYNHKNELIIEQYTEIESLGSGVSFKTENTYDSFGNIISTENLSLDTKTSLWINNFKVEYDFNTSYMAKDIATPEYYHNDYQYMILEKRAYNYSDNAWVSDGYDEKFYYTMLNVNVNEPNKYEQVLPFYTNDGKLRINNAENLSICIWNSQGILVYCGGFDIDISSYPKGTYIYQLNNDGIISTGKFLKK